MTAKEMNQLANDFNQALFDKADADIDHIEIEIEQEAKLGGYYLEYEFIPGYNLVKVKYIKTYLEENGYKVELLQGENYTIIIDWFHSK